MLGIWRQKYLKPIRGTHGAHWAANAREFTVVRIARYAAECALLCVSPYGGGRGGPSGIQSPRPSRFRRLQISESSRGSAEGDWLKASATRKASE